MGSIRIRQPTRAVAVDDDENVVDEFTLGASKAQAGRLTGWAEGFGKRVWAVESANGLGYLISQQLVACGETVFDVPPVLASRVRLLGSGRSQKNDSNDARSIAIAALRSDRLATVQPDDHVRVLRLLVKRHRDMARLRNKHCSRLHALLLELAAGGIGVKISVTNASELLDAITTGDEATRYRVLIAREVVTTSPDSTKRCSRAVELGREESRSRLQNLISPTQLPDLTLQLLQSLPLISGQPGFTALVDLNPTHPPEASLCAM